MPKYNDLARRKHLSFTLIIGEAPPMQTRTMNSPYGGIWEAVDALEIAKHDTSIGDTPVLVGYSPWAMIQMADRLEARRAATSLHNYARRTAADEYRLEVMNNDELNAFHVRKVARNGSD